MKLVEFNETKKRKVYINPEYVQKVAESGDKTIIYLRESNAISVVIETIDEVVKKLTQDTEF